MKQEGSRSLGGAWPKVAKASKSGAAKGRANETVRERESSVAKERKEKGVLSEDGMGPHRTCWWGDVATKEPIATPEHWWNVQEHDGSQTF